MRFSFASVALLALAHLLAPGVHGAPAVVSDHPNSLAVRQLPSPVNELVNAVLDTVLGVLGNTSGSLGSTIPIPPELAQQLAQQIAQVLQNRTASGMLARGPSSSESTSPTTLLPTTTSHGLPVSTDRIGESTVSGVSTARASSTPQTRMRRQSPSGLPSSVLSEVLSIVGSQSTALPVESILASVLSVASSKLGSVASQSAVSKPTPSKH
ncbi:hypothetical protein J3R82DRAFT_299 [Butyriboletus roseoflavus]|nr:hypothetical protein J3R82DRAFT_299 [Butyriboletus roseoflavus]